MKRLTRYKIVALTLQGKPLTFHVAKYEIVEGDFIQFIDEKTGKNKQFHASRCEIEEVSHRDY